MNSILGLAPQALCWRPLRGLNDNPMISILGLAPQALCCRSLRELNAVEIAIFSRPTHLDRSKHRAFRNRRRSSRSERQHKAWGASPRIEMEKHD